MEINIERINELARLSKTRELTDNEKIEQQKLRKQYIANYRASLRSQLDNIVLVDKDGNKTKVKPKTKKEK